MRDTATDQRGLPKFKADAHKNGACFKTQPDGDGVKEMLEL